MIFNCIPIDESNPNLIWITISVELSSDESNQIRCVILIYTPPIGSKPSVIGCMIESGVIVDPSIDESDCGQSRFVILVNELIQTRMVQ